MVAELLTSPEGAGPASPPPASGGPRRPRSSPRPSLTFDAVRAAHITAVVQVLGTAAVWQALQDVWDMDGDAAVAAVTTVIDVLLTGPGATGATATSTHGAS